MKLERVRRPGAHTHHVGRTLAWFRRLGFLCAKTEKTALIIRPGMPAGFARIGPKQDLFGVADIVAVPPATYPGRKGTWFVQVCAFDGASAHRRKALDARIEKIPVLGRIEASGNRFLIVKYRLVRTPPRRPGSAGRLVWQRQVEESLGEAFVDWTSTDFELLEVGREKKERRPRASPDPAVPALFGA